MFVDYHTHHERCGHATGVLRDYVEQAIKVGLQQIGLSDHMPIIHLPKEKIYPGSAMELDELEEYVKEVLDLKAEYQNQIEIKLGLEGDYIEGYEEQIEKLLSPYPFDYIIGSVHFLGEWDHSDSRQMEGWRKKPISEIFAEYYQAVQRAAKSGLYDIVGHFDVIKKHGHAPEKDISPIIDETLQVIKASGMAMEVNTSGLFKVVKEVFPAPSIIQKAVDLEIPFTLGSDAHLPEHVHVGVEEGRKLLKEFGVQQIATFTERQRIMVSL
ncbi:histidinol-phosphatase HisJ [Tepidibacillus sp. HK-1]|uniref:histidinol-phosphatase HisJ n=1 Tax=Tepidibacillus sp. HK-1 TaxID=1883407 RepID=UPI0008534549|nr:histidinol-phosphatase HisJ [Tepidibacillus sp. HK-1]GBF10628.1 histidinol-phosphatase [Tepidibacillus sp. HK-1]